MRADAHSPPVGDEPDGGRTVGLPRSCGPRRHPRLLATVAPSGGVMRQPASQADNQPARQPATTSQTTSDSQPDGEPDRQTNRRVHPVRPTVGPSGGVKLARQTPPPFRRARHRHHAATQFEMPDKPPQTESRAGATGRRRRSTDQGGVPVARPPPRPRFPRLGTAVLRPFRSLRAVRGPKANALTWPGICPITGQIILFREGLDAPC